jgi:hypothetical protein
MVASRDRRQEEANFREEIRSAIDSLGGARDCFSIEDMKTLYLLLLINKSIIICCTDHWICRLPL